MLTLIQKDHLALYEGRKQLAIFKSAELIVSQEDISQATVSYADSVVQTSEAADAPQLA